MGQKKADYPMLRGGVLSAPALVTLRITDGREGRAGAPVEMSKALQCQTGEARTLACDIPGMLSFAFSLVVISIYLAWNFVSVWVSFIFGLYLC